MSDEMEEESKLIKREMQFMKITQKCYADLRRGLEANYGSEEFNEIQNKTFSSLVYMFSCFVASNVKDECIKDTMGVFVDACEETISKVKAMMT